MEISRKSEPWQNKKFWIFLLSAKIGGGEEVKP